MKTRWLVLALGLSAAMASSPAASAEMPKGVSVSAAVVPLVSGAGGTGFGAPDYTDMFDTGFGIRVEPYMDITPVFRGQAGLAYQTWSGKDYGGLAFDDLTLWALYLGGRYRLFPGQKIRPYALLDMGLAYIEPVDVRFGGTRERYWDTTVTVFGDVGAGVEFAVSANLSITVDARLLVFGPPDSSMPPDSDAEGGGAVPLSLGINYTF